MLLMLRRSWSARSPSERKLAKTRLYDVGEHQYLDRTAAAGLEMIKIA
jgi:hypothetical protein